MYDCGPQIWNSIFDKSSAAYLFKKSIIKFLCKRALDKSRILLNKKWAEKRCLNFCSSVFSSFKKTDFSGEALLYISTTCICVCACNGVFIKEKTGVIPLPAAKKKTCL